MTLTLSIDPGVKNACAVWYEARLVTAQLCAGLGGQVHTSLEGIEPVVMLARSFGLFDSVVIEKPVVYDTAHRKGDQQDLIGLAIVVGALTSALAPYAKSILHVTPAQWKGQTPKKVTEQRARKALTEDELAVVELPRGKKGQTDVWDAIGIGLHHLQMAHRRSFISLVACHPQAFEHPPRGSSRPYGAWGSMAVRLTMGLGTAAKVVALHHPGKTLSLGYASDVDKIAGLKHAHIHLLPHLYGFNVRYLKFA